MNILDQIREADSLTKEWPTQDIVAVMGFNTKLKNSVLKLLNADTVSLTQLMDIFIPVSKPLKHWLSEAPICQQPQIGKILYNSGLQRLLVVDLGSKFRREWTYRLSIDTQSSISVANSYNSASLAQQATMQ